jgi:hypothetical protein
MHCHMYCHMYCLAIQYNTMRLSQLADPPGLLLLTIPLCCNLFALQVRESVMLHMPASLPAWAAHLERQEDRAGPSLVKRTALH